MIKTHQIALFAVLLSLTGTVLGEHYTKKELKIKAAGFSRMSNTGTGLLAGGILLDCIGPVLIATGIQRMVDDDDWDSYSNTTPDGYWTMYAGMYTVSFGIIMTVGGGVLRKIGRKKKNEYTRRLEKLSLQVTPTGASLVYDF